MSTAVTDVRVYYEGYEECQAVITVQRTRDPGLGMYSCPLPEDLKQRLRDWLGKPPAAGAVRGEEGAAPGRIKP